MYFCTIKEIKLLRPSKSDPIRLKSEIWGRERGNADLFLYQFIANTRSKDGIVVCLINRPCTAHRFNTTLCASHLNTLSGVSRSFILPLSRRSDTRRGVAAKSTWRKREACWACVGRVEAIRNFSQAAREKKKKDLLRTGSTTERVDVGDRYFHGGIYCGRV